MNGDDNLVILVDDKGIPTGIYAPKEKAHLGLGLHHLAITVLLENFQGEVLLQLRKHIRFDKVWDLTGATDLYHHPGHNEDFMEATRRCLIREYGIQDVVGLQKLGGFNYFAKWGELCENEYCALMFGKYEGQITLNHLVAYDCKWIKKEQFLADIKANPQNYTPWAVAAAKLLTVS